MEEGEELRRQVVRQARYALNTHALQIDSVPPEGVFDTALTSALVALVAFEWPGKEANSEGHMLPARRLLKHIEEEGGQPVGHS